jgi:lipopolysaccharide cholinephosphotransferase
MLNILWCRIFIIILIIIIIVFSIFNRKKFSLIFNKQPFSYVWEEKDKKLIKEIILTLKDCMKILNIEFFLVYGSLIGIARHKGFIPWDDDMDICVSENDFNKILNNKELFIKNGLEVYIIKKVFTRKKYMIKIFSKKGIKIDGIKWTWPFIDIFLYKQKNNKIIFDDDHDDYEFDYKDIFPLKTNLFEGISFSIPKNLDKINDTIYGNNWEKMCYSSSYNHRLEKELSGKHFKIDCKNINYDIDESIFDNTWIINLERKPERLKKSIERLNKIGIKNCKVWKATDGNSEEIKKIYEKIPTPKRSIYEYACTLSHRKLWEHIYSLNISYGIIFEDDIIFTKYSNKDNLLTQIKNSNGFDILFLGYCYPNNKNVKCCEPEVGSALCTHAYVISREAIKKLLEKEIDFTIPIDDMLGKYCKNNLCFLSYDITDKYNFGYGIVKQDNNIESDIKHSRGLKLL